VVQREGETWTWRQSGRTEPKNAFTGDISTNVRRTDEDQSIEILFARSNRALIIMDMETNDNLGTNES